jgi:hypothetical protein
MADSRDDEERPRGIFSSVWDVLKGLDKARSSGLTEGIAEMLVGGALGASGAVYGPYNQNATPFWANRAAVHQQRQLAQLGATLGMNPQQQQLLSAGAAPGDVYKLTTPSFAINSRLGVVETPPPTQGGTPFIVPGTAPPAVPKYLSSANAIRTAYLMDSTNPQNQAAMKALEETEKAAAQRPADTAAARQAGETIADKPGIVWLYADGRPMLDQDGPISTAEAKQRGGRPVSPKVASDVSAGQQGLVMLKNMADVVDRLQRNGKLQQATGLEALWDRANLRWMGYSADPDLAELQGYSSDLIIIARNLGEKGVRAIQAYEGMLSLIATGRAPYTAIKNYMKNNLDSALRAGVPKQVPNAYKAFPGARKMGAASEGTIDPGTANIFIPRSMRQAPSP